MRKASVAIFCHLFLDRCLHIETTHVVVFMRIDVFSEFSVSYWRHLWAGYWPFHEEFSKVTRISFFNYLKIKNNHDSWHEDGIVHCEQGRWLARPTSPFGPTRNLTALSVLESTLRLLREMCDTRLR